jgi:hypothetical protein
MTMIVTVREFAVFHVSSSRTLLGENFREMTARSKECHLLYG